MKASRITAIGLVAAAGLWIALPHETAESHAGFHVAAPESKKPFRVAVQRTTLESHRRKLTVSGRTEADRRVTVMVRTGGVLTELRVKRGSRVAEGDVIAVLSDEARESQVAQARSLVVQRRTELEVKRRLAAAGAAPKLDLVNLEAQLDAAKAALAAAEAERERGMVRAPWSGVISDVMVEVGKAAFSFVGAEIATLLSLDPMLAVVEVSERKVGEIKLGDSAEVRLITGATATGKVRFVSKTASQSTRTYRVEVELPNREGAIPDGITSEVSLPLAPVPATRVPRSALTISSNGDIGVRIVSETGIVGFVPVTIVEDEHTAMWVGGIADQSRVIVQGQDFVREGQFVDAIEAPALSAEAQ